jgi:hypothetical protein
MAKSSREAPTTQAKQQPNALTLTPSSLGVNAIISTAVTTVKYTPPKIAVPRMARGMSRRGFRASSPRVAAASNPANESSPKTIPRKSVETSVPGSGENRTRVNVAPFGALPASSCTSTTTAMTRISATVAPSTLRSTPPARRAGTTARVSANSSSIPRTRNPAQSGWLVQIPSASRNAEPKMPAADEISRA